MNEYVEKAKKTAQEILSREGDSPESLNQSMTKQVNALILSWKAVDKYQHCAPQRHQGGDHPAATWVRAQEAEPAGRFFFFLACLEPTTAAAAAADAGMAAAEGAAWQAEVGGEAEQEADESARLPPEEEGDGARREAAA